MSSPELQAAPASRTESTKRRTNRRLIGIASVTVVALALAAAALTWRATSTDRNDSVVTAPVVIGSIEQTLLATGTLKPVKLVSVGAQASGRIIAAALAVGVGFAAFGLDIPLVYSITSIVAAVACSTLIGVAFGYLPARNAARLDPVVALARE